MGLDYRADSFHSVFLEFLAILHTYPDDEEIQMADAGDKISTGG